MPATVNLPALFNSSLSRLMIRYAVLRDTSSSSATSVAVKNRLFAGMAVLCSAIIPSFLTANSNGVPLRYYHYTTSRIRSRSRTATLYKIVISFDKKTPNRRAISCAHFNRVLQVAAMQHFICGHAPKLSLWHTIRKSCITPDGGYSVFKVHKRTTLLACPFIK